MTISYASLYFLYVSQIDLQDALDVRKRWRVTIPYWMNSIPELMALLEPEWFATNFRHAKIKACQ